MLKESYRVEYAECAICVWRVSVELDTKEAARRWIAGMQMEGRPTETLYRIVRVAEMVVERLP